MRTGHGRQRLRLSEAGFEANAGCRGFHLDVRCGYREETFPGTTGNGQDAPIAVMRSEPIGWFCNGVKYGSCSLHVITCTEHQVSSSADVRRNDPPADQ